METVSFICTVFNHSPELVQRMINSVNKAMLYRLEFNYDFLIINNGEQDYTSLKTIDGDTRGLLTIVDTGSNLGYCGGNNIGISKSNAEFIFIINPDIIITNSLCIDWMVGSSKLNHSVSGWMIGTNEWYTYASTFPTASKYEPDLLPFYPTEPTLEKTGRWKAFRYIDGSFMCFPRALAIDIDGFDEDIFPGYFGENVFCFKAFLAGYKIDNVPCKDFYEHKHGKRTSEYESQIHTWSKLGRQLFYEKYALRNWDKFIEYLN